MRSIKLLVVLTAVALATAACGSEEAATLDAATPTASSAATPSIRPAPQRSVAAPTPKPDAKKQAALDEQLIAAAWKNDLRRARALIDQGADVNAKDNTVQSAYLISTSEGYLELLNLTLRNGADVDSKDSFNGTGLIRAADRGHADIAGRLIQASRSTTSITWAGPRCTRRSSWAMDHAATSIPCWSWSLVAPFCGCHPNVIRSVRSTTPQPRGTTRSQRCCSTASRSVKDLLSRTAVSASALLRPRFPVMLRR